MYVSICLVGLVAWGRWFRCFVGIAFGGSCGGFGFFFVFLVSCYV